MSLCEMCHEQERALHFRICNKCKMDIEDAGGTLEKYHDFSTEKLPQKTKTKGKIGRLSLACVGCGQRLGFLSNGSYDTRGVRNELRSCINPKCARHGLTKDGLAVDGEPLKTKKTESPKMTKKPIIAAPESGDELDLKINEIADVCAVQGLKAAYKMKLIRSIIGGGK